MHLRVLGNQGNSTHQRLQQVVSDAVINKIGDSVKTNYEAISKENQLRYGTDIGRIGPMLLVDRYDDRTHFIFELLQNAEDALRRRSEGNENKGVHFNLTPTSLTIAHFGKPFDLNDVRGICGIAESTKDAVSIGRFGIGFKSVYTFTARPEIHSGSEEFAIENYVQPKHVESRNRKPNETLIVLPLKPEDKDATSEITSGLMRLGPSALLFLRHIEEINWSVEGRVSGFYLRNAPVTHDSMVQQISVIGQESGKSIVDETWMVFHREVYTANQEKVGRVELAFSLNDSEGEQVRFTVKPLDASPLVVFFPTVVSTNLGFLVQGPYRTTPSRDNISQGDEWNQYLVRETAQLLVEAMRWMRNKELLDTSALRCLPLDPKKFPENSMFFPLFEIVRQTLKEEPLLPKLNGGYIEARHSKLARTQELRELLSSDQLSELFGEPTFWLTGDITADKEPEIRDYVMNQLKVAEVTPETIISKFNEEFLVSQTDEWIVRLYEFLNGQKAALRRHIDTIPLLRLSDGSQVRVKDNGISNAFFPSELETGFPTIDRNVCSTPTSREFLVSLGITEADSVDDVVRNILPKYQQEEFEVSDEDYDADIQRILKAFSTDSKSQRDKLQTELRKSTFLRVVDTGDGELYFAYPEQVYLATERLKQLFSGVPNLYIIDEQFACLRGEPMRNLFESCGVQRNPRPVKLSWGLTDNERRELRIKAGHAETSHRSDVIEDYDLEGIEKIIEILPSLDTAEKFIRSRLMWDSLSELAERSGKSIFEGSYTWKHYGGTYKKEFESAFLRRLNSEAWVPNLNGELQLPSTIIFDTLGWKANYFLLDIIKFKPPIIDQLAREAGIDPAALDLLKKLGITSVAELTSRLGILELPNEINSKPLGNDSSSKNIYSEAMDLYGDDMPDLPPVTFNPDSDVEEEKERDWGREQTNTNSGNSQSGDKKGNHSSQNGSNKFGGTSGTGGNSQGKRTPGQGGGRPFISYVGMHPEDNDSDPDGLDQVTRMKIEALAIDQIIKIEPSLNRTPEGNPGYDLFEKDKEGNIIRWIEVKSMTGSLENRPVGLSRTQFDCAKDCGSAYWLYVVEYATVPEKTRILRIQNPVAQARTFTFDHGWIHIAKTEPPITTN